MTVLIPTTTVRIVRPDATSDPYEAGTESTVTFGVPAHISTPNGFDKAVGGDEELVTAVALLPPDLDIRHYDNLVDEGTGERYFVAWVRSRSGLGLDHTKAGLRAVKGGSGG